MRNRKRLLLILLIALAQAGCTIIRYVDDDDGNNTTGPPPKVVDMLVLVEMERGTANLTQDIGKIVGVLQFALSQQNIAVRQSAMAPMYGRSEGVVPILYGENDPDSEFGSFADAIFFYTQDDGVAYLNDHAQTDVENLSILGGNLDQRAVYHPTTADPTSTAYFQEAADGFIVVHIAASPRRCSAENGDCAAIGGTDPAKYFTQTNEDGNASWLTLPGGTGLPTNKIFHAVVATAEGVDYEEFYAACSAFPNFPATKLDVMEPSNNIFFTDFAEGIKDSGGRAQFLDLCEAMSARGEVAVAQMSVNVRQMF